MGASALLSPIMSQLNINTAPCLSFEQQQPVLQFQHLTRPQQSQDTQRHPQKPVQPKRDSARLMSIDFDGNPTFVSHRLDVKYKRAG